MQMMVLRVGAVMGTVAGFAGTGLSVADAVYMYPIVGFLVLGVVAFVSSLYFWLRYRKDAKEVESALDRVRLAGDEAERLLWRRSHEYHREYLDADYPDKQAIWDKNEQMWEDYKANPAKYIGDELSATEAGKYGKLSRIWEAYIGAGLILVALLLLVLVGVGLWGVAILAFSAFLFATGWAGWVDDSEYAPARLGNIPASIAAAAVVAAILIPVSGWATSSPPPGWVAQTHEVTLARQANGAYGVGEPSKARLDGSVSKGKEPSSAYSWSELDSNNAKSSYDSYYPDSGSRQVRIVDDLADGEAPYVQHYYTFDVLNGYSDNDVCYWGNASVFNKAPQFAYVPCSKRNAWVKRENVVIHIPRGQYDHWVARSA